MQRRDFVRASGASVALLTGCIGGPSDGDDGEGQDDTTDNGSDGIEEDGGDLQNQTETDGGEADDNGQDESEEDTEEPQPGYEEAGYTRFMYDPETAGVDVDVYVFTHTSADASQELTEEIQGEMGFDGRIARTEVRATETDSDEGQPSGVTRDTVTVRVYKQESSFRELTGPLAEPVDSRSGYDVYEAGESVFGINEDRLTVIEGPNVDRIQLVAETLEGEAPSYAESSDDMRVLTDAVGTGDAVLIRGGLPESDIPGVESALASATSLSEDEGTISIRYAVVYPDDGGANAAVSADSSEEDTDEDTEETSDEVTPLFALAVTELNLRPEDIDVSDQTANGRVAVLEASVETDAFLGG